MKKITQGVIIMTLALCSVLALPTSASAARSGGIDGGSWQDEVSQEAFDATKQAATDAANELKAACLNQFGNPTDYENPTQANLMDICSDVTSEYFIQMWSYLATNYAAAMGENVNLVPKPSQSAYLAEAYNKAYPTPPC